MATTSARIKTRQRRRRPIRRATLLTTGLLLALAGCGDGGSSTTILTHSGPPSETQTTATSTQTQTTPTSGPRGSLDFGGVGPAVQGSSTDQVRQAFGSPDRTKRVVGCELGGPNAPKVDIWTWDLPDGDFILTFNAADGKLRSYRTTSSKLPTTAGVRVGDPFQGLRDSYGATLRPLRIGSATPSAQAGIWFVKKSATSQLTFDVAAGKVRTVSGGVLEICE